MSDPTVSDDPLACESCSADLHPRDDAGYRVHDVLVCAECGASNEVDTCEDVLCDGAYGEELYIGCWWCSHGVYGEYECAQCEAEDDATGATP